MIGDEIKVRDKTRLAEACRDLAAKLHGANTRASACIRVHVGGGQTDRPMKEAKQIKVCV